MSDLHIEFPWHSPSWLPPIGEDVVILAGDVHTGVNGIEWAINAFRGRPVLYVLGNHEFYREHWDYLIAEARATAEGTNVQLLEQDRAVIDGVLFLGATMWTDFELYGTERRIESMQAGVSALTDFRLIKTNNGLLKPDATIERHTGTTAWLTREIEAATQRTVVITHHSPSIANEHPQYVGSALAPCFHSARDDLFRPPVRLWISGHTHFSSEAQVNGIPLLSNQRGYPREGVAFTWDALVEV